jgi:riboflavin kinase
MVITRCNENALLIYRSSQKVNHKSFPKNAQKTKKHKIDLTEKRWRFCLSAKEYALKSALKNSAEDDVRAYRDEQSKGCSECYFSRESDRTEKISKSIRDLFSQTSDFAGTTTAQTMVLVIGIESGKLIERILKDTNRNHNVKVIACDLSEKQIVRAMELVPDSAAKGNERGCKFVALESLDFKEIKPYFGPFDVIIFNDTFEDFVNNNNDDTDNSRKDFVARVCNLLKQRTDGKCSRIVISSRERKEGLDEFKRLTKMEIRAMFDLTTPLVFNDEEVAEYKGKSLKSILLDDSSKTMTTKDAEENDNDDDNELDSLQTLYLAKNYKLEKPIIMRAKVVRGFGRGSAQMGLPTANLDPEEVAKNGNFSVENVPLGVYFGYCRLLNTTTTDDEEEEEEEKKIAVLNVGRRPTFVDKKDYENDVTIEVHCVELIGDKLAFDLGRRQFYGETMEVECVGFVRPEMKFQAIDELVTRIKTDVGLSKNSLSRMKYV